MIERIRKFLFSKGFDVIIERTQNPRVYTITCDEEDFNFVMDYNFSGIATKINDTQWRVEV